MSIYENVVVATEKALEELLREENPKITGRQILAWVLDHKNDFDFNVEELKPSWGAYLTRAISDPETRVAREPGKYNNTLKDKKLDTQSLESAEESESEHADEVPTVRQQRETVLYQLLVDWMRSQGYRASITALTKKGLKWGNPDVTGLLILEDPFNHQLLEIGTIEAKLSLTDWRKFFFEAVSHKRFSNRAYFAFCVGSSEPSVSEISDYSEIRKYGEKYQVGIVVVFLKK